MKRKNIFFVIAIVAVLALVFTGCSGKKETSSISNTESSSQSVSSGGGNDSLFDVPKDKISTGGMSASTDRNAVLAEIPVEILKGVGELQNVSTPASINNYPLGSGYGWKYVLTMEFNVKSGENAINTLMDYYKSIGGTVTNQSKYYSVVFDWAESVPIETTYSTFQGKDYVKVQFHIVKE